MGKSFGSKLTFVVRQTSGETPELHRVREPVSRSKSGVQGKVADVQSGRSRHAESLNELNGLRVLLASARADVCQEQPFVMEYYDGGKRRYTPDVLLRWGEFREVVEIKEDSEANLPDNQRRFALLRELLAEHGFPFRVWKKSEICSEPRLTNSSLVLRYRSVVVSAVECERIRRLFSLAPQLTLAALSRHHQISVQSVFRLVLQGILHINWWSPLTSESTVSIVPIGPQVWPIPQQ